MPFGLQGSSSVLMRVMKSTMTQDLRTPTPDVDQPERVGAAGHGVPGASGPLHRSVVVYMDAILRQEKLYVKASKCEYGRGELGFLGHRVSAAGVAVDPRKLAAVRDWPTPTSNVGLRRFIGLCNYYRRFVDGYADIASQLTRLCGPHAPWSWGPAEQASFDRLKACLTTAPVLRNSDSSRLSIPTTGASEKAILAVLAQPDDGGVHHPVAYQSRKLTAAEQA